MLALEASWLAHIAFCLARQFLLPDRAKSVPGFASVTADAGAYSSSKAAVICA
jgi:hypothetical protein